MADEPGDRRIGQGDHDTRYNSTGSEIGAGYWVTPSGDEDVALADASPLTGVAVDPMGNGEYGNVTYRGVVFARVDSAVSAGDELAVPDSGTTGEEAGVAEAGGASGLIALTGAKAAGDGGPDYAKVLLR